MVVSLSGIVMDYPGTRALDGVSAEFRYDEVHGLIGENGAGKSTLVGVLGGNRVPTAGAVAIDGETVRLASPADALRRGIAFVSQEGSLVPGLTGAQNILLGAEPRWGLGVVRQAALRRQAADLLKRWFPDVAIDLGRPVDGLPMADRKVIEIVRALRGDIRLLILDEPTATLPAREKESLCAIIRTLPARGVGIVLISHFLSEIRALSNRITVLRDGRHVATLPAAETSEGQLADMMLQRSGNGTSHEAGNGSRRDLGATVLEVRGWRTGDVEVERFGVRAGEIVGLIGLTGAGHFGFARSLFVQAEAEHGEALLCGEPVGRAGAGVLKRRGVALIPDQRMANALIADWDVRENLAMVHPHHAAWGRSGVLRRRREGKEATAVMRLLNVRPASHAHPLKALSGGNKQKVAIGKWLYGAGDRYRLMIFIEPTEGVDIGAKREIHDHLRRLADKGVALIVASSDLLEVIELADRVVPFVRGRPGAEIRRGDFAETRLIAAMTGVTS